MGRAFGPRPLPLGALLVALHALAALLLGRLATKLGATGDGPMLVALCFLFFAAPNSVFGSVAQLARPLTLVLSLLALLSLAAYLETGRRAFAVGYAALYVAALLVFEDLALLPLLGVALVWAMQRPRKGVLLAHVAAFACLAASLAWTAACGAPSAYGLSLGRDTAIKAAALPVELARDLLLLHADLRGRGALPPALNLALVLALLALAAAAAKPAWTLAAAALRSRGAAYALAFIALAAAPALARPTGAVWHSRYLYAPGAGLALLLGLVAAPTLAAMPPGRRLAPALLAAVLLAGNVATMEHMVRKIQGEWAGIAPPGRRPEAFAYARALNRQVSVSWAPPTSLDRSERLAACRWVRDSQGCLAANAAHPEP